MTLPAVFFRPVLLLPLLAAGCGDAGDSEPVDTFAAQVEARAGVPFAQEGAVVSLDVPQAVAAGAPVPITIRVKNETAAPLDLYLRGRDVIFDITVADSTGDVVWRKLEGEVTQAILQLKTLAPGEVMELSHSWDQKSHRGQLVAPGRYTVRGSVLTDGQTTLDSPPATMEIKPR
jgi:hypothetical protein